MAFRLGPEAKETLTRFGRLWRQGQHVLITGPTDSGKSTLARFAIEERIKRGGFVAVLVAKPAIDRTITTEYRGWKRWKTWRDATVTDQRVLLWPDVSRAKSKDEMIKIQKSVFEDFYDRLLREGIWTVVNDEGLYMADSMFMNLSSHIAMGHQIGRSSDATWVTLTQRPAHLPVVVYSSAAHAFLGRSREKRDKDRLAELGGRESSDELADLISNQSLHDFTWVPVASDLPAQRLRLDR